MEHTKILSLCPDAHGISQNVLTHPLASDCRMEHERCDGAKSLLPELPYTGYKGFAVREVVLPYG